MTEITKKCYLLSHITLERRREPKIEIYMYLGFKMTKDDRSKYMLMRKKVEVSKGSLNTIEWTIAHINLNVRTMRNSLKTSALLFLSVQKKY